MIGSVVGRRVERAGACAFRVALLGSVSFLAMNCLGDAQAGQLTTSAFQPYNAANASSIQAGPFSLFTVPVGPLLPTQINEGFTEVDKKATGFDILLPSQLTSNLITDIEPVVIGPGGTLYLTDGHHTFTALLDSAYGPSDPTVFVNVIANLSNLTTSQFFAQMQAMDLLLPLNNGVPQVVNLATGAPIPTSLQGLIQDPYRGLEYSILKNKNSKLFKTTANIGGAVGSAIPGLDKITGLYGDFIWADAYRNANGGLGLPTLSTGDALLATQWNLNPNSATSEPNVGAVTVAQLPGFILNKNITISSTISNATLSTGTLDGNGGFTGITSFNLGTPSNPIMVGTPQSGLVMQLGNDAGFTATLSGTNTYTGGTTIIAGDLIIASDAALGAAPPSTFTLNPNNILGSVQAANGIIFNSLTEGNGTLTIGTTPGNGTATFTTNRPIAVDGEVATINVNGYVVTLGGPLVSLGTNGNGLGNATGISDLTIDDLSAGNNGKLILSTASPNFFGNIIVGNTGAPIVEVMSDAALGATNLPASQLGQVELNGGIFQAGANIVSHRNVFLGGGSSFDTNGFTSSFASLQDTQRTLTLINSSTSAAGSVTFGTLEVSATATLNINAGAGTGGGHGNALTLTNGIIRDPGATLILQPTTTGNLGTLAAGTTNSENVFNGLSSQDTPTNGIVAPWIVVYAGIPSNQTPASPFSFATYGANGYTATAGNSTNILTATSTSVVQQSAGATLTANTSAYALSVQNGKAVNLGTHTLTLGNGTNPAGLILNGGASVTNGTLAFGGSEGVIWIAGQSNNTNTISAQITGSGGLTFAGGVHATDLSGISKSKGLSVVNITTATAETGAIIIDSGAVALNAVNVFASSVPGVYLEDTKSSPSPATLNITRNNQFTALSSAGNNSTINLSNGAALTIGDTTNNFNSTLSSTISETGTAVTGVLGGALGAINKNGSGLLDISGSGVTLVSGSNVLVNAGALRIGNGVFGASATNPILVASGAELQYSGNFGSVFNDPIQGSGVFHLVGGTVQLTGTNTYTGGTVIEIGAMLDVTTANLPANAVVTNAGGTLLFDQSTNGTFAGVMGDGRQSGGPNNPNDMTCTLVSCSGPTLSGTLIKDDSTTGKGGNVTLSSVQAYSGLTYIEAGTLTLGAVDTIKSSAGVILGRVGGAVCNPSPCPATPTAILALGANNTISGLADDPANTTQVQLNGNRLTVAPITGSTWTYAGSIVDGSAAGGSLVLNGPGTLLLTGTSSYTGPTAINAGMLEVNGAITSSSSVAVNSGGTLSGTGSVDPPAVTIFSGGTFAPGLPGVPGTSMTISGNLAFMSGALYVVTLNSSTSSFANVTGTAALGGNVLAMFQPGINPLRSYTILTSTGLNGTTFAGVSSPNPNFDASLSYTNTNVLLGISAALGSGTPLNGNELNVAGGINNFFNRGGTLPANFLDLFNLTGGSLATSLAQLSGEIGTTAITAGLDSNSQFLDLLFDPYGGSDGMGAHAMGFAPERAAPDVPDVLLGYAKAITKAPAAPLVDDRWSVWGGGFGGQSTASGDPLAGSNGIDVRNAGFSTGFDRRLSPDSMIGFAVAGSSTNFSLSNGLGSGNGDIFQAAAYGSTRIDQFYVSGAGLFSGDQLSTSRVIAPAGTMDQLTSKFNAYGLGGRLEAGRRFPVMTGFGVTPFAALQGQSMWTPSYTETSAFGSGFALTYASQTTDRLRSELGAGIDSRYLASGGQITTFYARAAWGHEYLRSTTANVAFLALPGSGFSVQGAQPPTDAAIAKVGSVLTLTNGVSFRAKLEGEFGNGSTTYGATGTVRYTW